MSSLVIKLLLLGTKSLETTGEPLAWDSKGGSLAKRLEDDLMRFEQKGPSSPRWFAVRVKSRAERMVASGARNKGFEEFLPLYHSRRRWSDRFKSIEVPLFPGYVFCRLQPERRLPLLTIPGVVNLVGIGRIPVPIDDGEIEAIQVAMRSGLWAEPYPFLEVGQRVRIEEGPLGGMEGFLVEVRKQQRIVVSLGLLKRSVCVEIERHWVRPLDTHVLPSAPVARRAELAYAGCS